MNLPNVRNVLQDPNRNIEYAVIAYRTLNQSELISAVRYAVSRLKKKPKNNSRFEFVTLIGLND